MDVETEGRNGAHTLPGDLGVMMLKEVGERTLWNTPWHGLQSSCQNTNVLFWRMEKKISSSTCLTTCCILGIQELDKSALSIVKEWREDMIETGVEKKNYLCRVFYQVAILFYLQTSFTSVANWHLFFLLVRWFVHLEPPHKLISTAKASSPSGHLLYLLSRMLINIV